jgi:hypothetical protein
MEDCRGQDGTTDEGMSIESKGPQTVKASRDACVDKSAKKAAQVNHFAQEEYNFSGSSNIFGVMLSYLLPASYILPRNNEFKIVNS